MKLCLVFALVLSLPLVFAGCGDGEDDIGAPCTGDDDCSGDLVCDEHEGKGSCQAPHSHAS